MIDSLFGWLNAPLSESGKTAAEQLLKAYRREVVYDKALDRAEDFLLPNEGRELDRQDKLLGIALKRRQLGYPMNDDDLEEALNDGGSEGLPIGGLALAGLGMGLTALARPGAGRAMAKGIGSIGQLFNRTVAHEAPRPPLYPNAVVGDLRDVGAQGALNIGRLFHMRQP